MVPCTSWYSKRPHLWLIKVIILFLGPSNFDFQQIDSGPFGIVYGVNKSHDIFCREGSACAPGGSWKKVPGSLKYVSCGIYGCWGANFKDQIWVRLGVTAEKCEGKKWVLVPGALKQVEVTQKYFSN